MVKTHREYPRDMDREPHYCYFCEKQIPAAYWTQNEFPDGKLQHPVIWHCQTHRDMAQSLAEYTIPARVCKYSSIEYGFDFDAPSIRAAVETRPITGINVTTRDGTYLVEFFRDNAIRSYRIKNFRRAWRLDLLLKKYCVVTDVNLFSCGQVSIWYGMK